MPTSFTKKAITITAEQWTGDNEAYLQHFTNGEFHAIAPEDRADDPDVTAEVRDHLHSTWIGVKTGQWVIKGVKGEFYPIDETVLAETYSKEGEKDVRTYRIQYNANSNRTEMFVEADSYGRANYDRPSVEFYRDGRTVAEIMAGSLVVVEEIPAEPQPVAAAELDDDGKPTPEAVLALPMERNDAGAATVREYLVALAAGVWTVGEGFSGKRPFGNSGWHTEIHQALGAKGWIRCELDGDGYVEDIDEAAGNELIAAALKHLAAAPAA
jgi:hypothetical protein